MGKASIRQEFAGESKPNRCRTPGVRARKSLGNASSADFFTESIEHVHGFSEFRQRIFIMARRNFRIKRTFGPVSKPNCPHFAAAQAAAAAYAFFVNNPVTRKCFVGIVFSLFNCAEAACRIAVPAVKARHTVDYCDSAEQKSLFGRKNLCFGSREKCSVVNFSAHMFPPFVQLSFRLRNLFSETFFLFVSPVFFKNGFIDTL
jgi:hypothetical protein